MYKISFNFLLCSQFKHVAQFRANFMKNPKLGPKNPASAISVGLFYFRVNWIEEISISKSSTFLLLIPIKFYAVNKIRRVTEQKFFCPIYSNAIQSYYACSLKFDILFSRNSRAVF